MSMACWKTGTIASSGFATNAKITFAWESQLYGSSISEAETAYHMTADEFTEVRQGELRSADKTVEISVPELFASAKKRVGR